MTQEREDVLTVADERDASLERDAEGVEVAEIRADIEETRVEMGGTSTSSASAWTPGTL